MIFQVAFTLLVFLSRHAVYGQTILEVAGSLPDFSTLASVARGIPDLQNKLDCSASWCKSYTVFAPINNAFDALDDVLLAKLTSPPYDEHLRALILYHMVSGELTANAILSVRTVVKQTEQGEFLSASGTAEGGISINENANVLATVEASNGIVHAVDAVLVPSFVTTDIVGIAQDAGVFGTLLSLATSAGLVEALQGEGLTLFAPTDEAFLKLPQEVVDSLLADPEGLLRDVLLYHVVPNVVPRVRVTEGSVTTVQGEDIVLNVPTPPSRTIRVNSASSVVQDDVFASNGVIHAIDHVLIPPSLNMAMGSLSVIISADPKLSTLSTVLELTGLDTTLDGSGPFTILAPTDEAFAELGQETIDGLLGNLDALTNILLYHVFGASVSREQLTTGIVTPLGGENLFVMALRTKVSFNQVSNLETFNTRATNGILHTIDQVLIPPPTLVEIATGNQNFSILVTALQAAELVDTLGGGPFTVFAPTNVAFSKLPPGTLDSLLADPEGALRDILLYHVVSGNVLAADMTNGPVTTVQGQDITVSLATFPGSTFVSGITLNGNSRVTATDIIASNGVVHVIDTVLLPETSEPEPEPEPEQPSIVDIAVSDDRFTILVAALTAADLVDALSGDGPFTVFAPINEAFASVPEKYLTEEWNSHLTDILLYHVISGEVLSTDLTFNMTVETLNGESVTVTSYPAPVQINGVEVILADVAASNGVIHVVDEVLLPSSATNTIVDIAVSTPALSTLVDLVTAAGLVDTLNSEGPFTVFAPTNEAFNKLDSTVVETLTNPDNVDDLTDVLTYHVVAGIVLSSELSVGDELTAANGDILTVTSIDPPTINDSIVLVGDILANNGVVHTIDTALIPP